MTATYIDKWIDDAEKTKFSLTQFIIATASRRDAKLFQHVAKLSDERMLAGKWPVNIIFWEDIEHFVKQRPELLSLYYPTLYYGIREIDKTKEDKYNRRQEENNCIQSGKLKEDDVRIKSENLLRSKFLDEIVKYRIQKMLRVDPFVGFDFSLVIDSDCFEVAVQDIIDRAIGINSTERFMKIAEFQQALDAFVKYMSGFCIPTLDGKMVRYYEGYGDVQALSGMIDQLRARAIELLNEIESA